MIKKYVLFDWLQSNETVIQSWLILEPVMISQLAIDILLYSSSLSSSPSADSFSSTMTLI